MYNRQRQSMSSFNPSADDQIDKYLDLDSNTIGQYFPRKDNQPQDLISSPQPSSFTFDDNSIMKQYLQEKNKSSLLPQSSSQTHKQTKLDLQCSSSTHRMKIEIFQSSQENTLQQEINKNPDANSTNYQKIIKNDMKKIRQNQTTKKKKRIMKRSSEVKIQPYVENIKIQHTQNQQESKMEQTKFKNLMKRKKMSKHQRYSQEEQRKSDIYPKLEILSQEKSFSSGKEMHNDIKIQIKESNFQQSTSFKKKKYSKSIKIQQQYLEEKSKLQEFKEQKITSFIKQQQKSKSSNLVKFQQDKEGKQGLRQLSKKVFQIMTQSTKTTYLQVAEELNKRVGQQNSGQDQKDYKRRVYDALNVMVAADVLKKQGKCVMLSKGRTRKGYYEPLLCQQQQYRRIVQQVRMKMQFIEDRKKYFLMLTKKFESITQFLAKKKSIKTQQKSQKMFRNPCIFIGFGKQNRPIQQKILINGSKKLILFKFKDQPKLYGDMDIATCQKDSIQKQLEKSSGIQFDDIIE